MCGPSCRAAVDRIRQAGIRARRRLGGVDKRRADQAQAAALAAADQAVADRVRWIRAVLDRRLGGGSGDPA